jgi:hypothetical protein
MNADKRFKQLERKTYLLTHQDGLLDIIIGLCIMGFGLNMFTDSAAFSVLAWMPVILLPGLKNRITVPRLGYAQFDNKRTGATRLLAVTMILGLVVLVAGVFIFLGVKSGSPEIVSWLKSYHMPLLAGIAAAVMIVSAVMSGIKRLFAYAALTLLVVVGGTALDIQTPFYVLLLGALIMLSGFVLLARFMRKYPVEQGEKDNAIA